MIDQQLRARVARLVGEALPAVVAFRHERHRHPELTWKEVETSKAVKEHIARIPGLALTEGMGRHGLVATLAGARPGPTIALRADMDALPVEEKTGKDYASCHKGVMHACGHDGHMANLYGSMLVLAQLRDELAGTVKFIFQPAEEGGRGAEVMVQDGVLDQPQVDVIFGLHGWPELKCGEVYVKTGAMLAATSDLRIVVRGTGCHAAMPHLGTDQVLIAARIVEGLQSVVSRFIAPSESVALSITKIHGGTAVNVIPPVVEMGGTLRTLSEKTRDAVVGQMRKLVEGIAAAHGASATIEFDHNYPATVNDGGATDYLERVAREVLPPGAVRRLPAPSMGGEDFAFFLQKARGAYFFLGVDDGRAGGYPGLHHPAYDFNDAALPVGMTMFVHAALGYASQHPLPVA
jgi:amidohydrolase